MALNMRARRTGPRFRPYLLWQLPTLCLTAVVTVGLVLGNPASNVPASALAGVVLVAAVAVVAAVIRWDRFPHRWQVILPLVSVGAVALIELRTVSVMPPVALVGLVPVLWLVFEFGRTGTALGIISVAALVCVAYLGDASLPSSGAEWAQLVMVSGVAVGLCLGARHVADRLQHKRQVLDEQSVVVESALELAHDRLLMVQAILDSVDAAILGYDRDGELILENSAAHELATRAGVDLTAPGNGRGHHVYSEDREMLVPADQRVLARAKRGEEVDPQTYWFGPPADQVAVMVSARQVRRRDGAPFVTVVVGWDVTEVLEAVRVREEFLTTVSHELRTPLTSILGYQELMAEELGPQEQRIAPMLATAQRNARVLLSRVMQLLEVAGANDLQIRRRPMDVSALLRDALAKHRVAAEAAGLRLAAKVEPGVSAHLDPAAWEQLVDNLVSNAIKYTPAGGRVEVALEDVGDALAMHVVDTGIGMSRTEQERAFDRFYRTTAARDRAIQGLGVGLSIARQIVDAHGGEVFLSSTLGRGTSVTVRAPLRPAPAET
ncbi:cell wall metabolism sensor histidine kinase WalK [Nocardioides sp. zg-DK7169]|uniref:sensor histidine kinase n=1 Tax=Nocardioides sp. zg-DK7169 TaxID=2736600 RepID=UPI0015530F60|nr:HAMP domain-containing sensor histidine kinase [Nocardioides sp. zg-DK7169]NPC96738.1 HAMP domain-containing histidine kinase [Nocardioides sp. zg-DK7169]